MWCVYVIQAGENGPIKVGRSKRPKQRLGQLQTGNHNQLTMMALAEFDTEREQELAEGQLQDKLWQQHIRGEWFNSTAMNQCLLLQNWDYLDESLGKVAEIINLARKRKEIKKMADAVATLNPILNAT